MTENRGISRAADVSNPFVSKPTSHPTSPIRRSGGDDMSALREGMARMNVVDRAGGDFTFPEARAKDKEYRGRDMDRFVPSRPAGRNSGSSLLDDLSDASNYDPSGGSLSASMGAQPNRRILSFRAAPPPSTHATSHLDAQRNYLIQSAPSTNRGTGTGATAAAQRKRAIPSIPEKVLDAPGFLDDYYLNLVDWSTANRVAIGLGDTPYVWDAESGAVVGLGDETDEETTPVCSVSWSPDGAYLAVGNDNGEVEIWDVEENTRMRVMAGHNARIPSLSWNGHLLSSGCKDGTIFHHDVRVQQHKVGELRGHSSEVCGLKWRPDGQLLASGGNDNVVNCWDSRMGASVIEQEGRGIAPKWTKRNHTAAVKALAWCPWQPNLLATGGGSADKHIHFWSTTTGARSQSLNTGSQVTSIIWSPHCKELLSTHGYPDNNISVWSYPSLTKIYDVPAHDNRVLASALSPDGCSIATGAGDENLKFWRIWNPKSVAKKADEDRDARGQTKGRIR